MSHSAFFYGTLLHPSILRRVIGHDGGQLQICPALLLEHTRHKIKHADYPAVIPYTKSKELFASAGHADLSPEERTVRGTFVQGLNDQDIHLLDLFEGDEYTRENVDVHPLGPLTPLSSTPVPKSSMPSSSETATDAYVVPLHAPSLPPLDALPTPLPAQTYIYAGPLTDLSPELWSYEDFVRENAWKWVGRSALEDNYVEVDRRRDMGGKTLRTEIIDTAAVPGSEDVGLSVAAEITA
ncbi:hypothetical protein L226DRAFT_560363 [Lentinus tigrinus ALCF2SS1-7]|uniref:Putative gamma-glutamylcyclotransferase n=1 Tax=Lentinus tigrinus ALCF2SS1-6 TaxID=1328759 RepID=A0A5C2SII2_9APHY|nr:hypothetical protein L227DRAFT_652974 [Lentinus tigrinus ALCF2SS1-6]RPD75301.1 hypothetical protein L226DRAFT_560363 [Lentinus tigrinus ALCF2SS1-7]